MSFLGDLISSIGGEKAPAPPIKPLSRPAISNPLLSNLSKSAPSTPASGGVIKSVYRGTAGTLASQQGSNLKRKADDISSERPVKLSKPSQNVQKVSDRDGQKPTKLNGSTTNSPTILKPTNGLSVPQNNLSSSKAPAKAPSKGSYAEIMARAKEAQSSKAPSQIGMIKHQTTEKIKISKLAERKKETQEKGKGAHADLHSTKPGHNGKIDSRHRSASPVKKGELSKPLKGPKPPLHAPAAPAYKGTMNSAPKKLQKEMRQKKPSKFDEYMGTDEEDEGDYDGYEGEDGYGDYSDESDMEGGFGDVEAEERAAERAAREDDARELALETKLKKEKLERKKKLEAMAAKRR